MGQDKRPEDQFDEFYTVGQLARILKLTQVTIYRMVSRGELPCHTIGRVKRFRTRDVEDFLKRCRTPMRATRGHQRPSS
jgi:excisionase family DNA binding protein